MGRKSEQSKKAYNQMASGYDESQEGSYTAPHKAELVKKVIIKDGDAVLDVACGNGVLLEKLSKKAGIHGCTNVHGRQGAVFNGEKDVEHYFHTKEQMQKLYTWLEESM